MNTEKQKQSHSPRDLHRQNHCERTHSRSFRCWKCWNTMPISLLVHLYHNQLPLEPALITNDAQFNTGYKYYHTFFRKSKKQTSFYVIIKYVIRYFPNKSQRNRDNGRRFGSMIAAVTLHLSCILSTVKSENGLLTLPVPSTKRVHFSILLNTNAILT